MKKIFTIGFLALALLLTGCGNDKTTPENKSDTKQENKQVTSESKPQTPPKELTEEEKAKQEAERKAAEEKRKKEATEREAKLQAEIAQKQARLDSLLNEGVQLNYEIEKLGESKYQVSGTTNLPDGMQIMVSLDSRSPVGESLGIPYDEGGLTQEQFKKLMDNSYVGQSNLNIRDGKFAIVFTGQKLSSGEYDVIISSPMNSQQSTEVQTMLGDKGINLFGTYVIEDKYGKRIHFEERFFLP